MTAPHGIELFDQCDMIQPDAAISTLYKAISGGRQVGHAVSAVHASISRAGRVNGREAVSYSLAKIFLRIVSYLMLDTSRAIVTTHRWAHM